VAHGGLAAVVLPVGVGDERDRGVEGELRRHGREARRVQRQPGLQALERVEDEESLQIEGEHREGVAEPGLLGAQVDAGEAVERPLDEREGPGAFEHAGEPGAEGLRQRGDDGAEEGDLDPAVDGHRRASEPLGPDERPAEIEEEAGDARGREDMVEAHGRLPQRRPQRAP
jgi:hypothetical protein